MIFFLGILFTYVCLTCSQFFFQKALFDFSMQQFQIQFSRNYIVPDPYFVFQSVEWHIISLCDMYKCIIYNGHTFYMVCIPICIYNITLGASVAKWYRSKSINHRTLNTVKYSCMWKASGSTQMLALSFKEKKKGSLGLHQFISAVYSYMT